MTSIRRKLDRIEKRLSIGRHEELMEPIVIVRVLRRSESTVDPDSLGPTNTWLTYQEQHQAIKKACAEELEKNPGAIPEIKWIILDADKELQARKAKCKLETE